MVAPFQEPDLRVRLPAFEGPLDLLLFLIRKNELDIYDIPISAITRQYMAALRAMQKSDLDLAGEFFVMAATLMEIKSRLLLPRGAAATGDEEEDGVDPRWELVHQLLQYKKFKAAAAELQALARDRQDLLPRCVAPLATVEGERAIAPIDRIPLWNAYNLALRRIAEKLVVGEIQAEEVTVADKMDELLAFVQAQPRFLFTDYLALGPVTVRVLVASFIAVLELTRLRQLRVRQREPFGEIEVEAVTEAERLAANSAAVAFGQSELVLGVVAQDESASATSGLPAAKAAAKSALSDDD